MVGNVQAEWTFPGTITFDKHLCMHGCSAAKKKLFGFAQDMHGFLLILDRAAYAQIPGLCKQDCVSKRRDDERSSRGKS
jgi:hypothetical protein